MEVSVETLDGCFMAGGVLVAPVGCGNMVSDSHLPAGYWLVYQQSFDHPAALSDFEFTNRKKWKFSEIGNGSGSMESLGPGDYKPSVRSPRVIALLSNRMYGDFILEADLLQTGKSYGHRDMCLFFGFNDPSHYYYAHIATKADNHAHNIFKVNNEPRVAIAHKTTQGIDWGKDQWHKVRVERTLFDGKIKIYYDDMTTPIMEAVDSTFTRGYLGLGSFDDLGKIDNIKIFAPQVTKKTSIQIIHDPA